MSPDKNPEYDLPVFQYEKQQAKYYRRAEKLQDAVDGAPDPEAFIHGQTHDLIAKVDKANPFMNESVVMSGYGITNTYVDGERVDEDEGTELTELWGVHQGVTFVLDETRQPVKWRVMQMIGTYQEVVEDEDGDPIIKASWAHMDMDATVTPAAEIESAFTDRRSMNVVTLGERLQRAEDYSAAMKRLLNDPAFQSLSHKRQQALLLERAEAADNDTQLRDVFTAISVRYCLVLGEGRKKGKFIERVNLDKRVEGVLLGLVSVETLLDHKQRIRRRKDIILKAAGLCLVLDPNEETREEYELKDHQPMYIPLVKVKNLALRD